MDLFEAGSNTSEPLAARMRPRTIQEFVGQDHIVGPGRLLRRAIDADQLSSLIFSGPPGTGKTTLARVIAGSTSSRFVSLNAVLAGVADIRREIASAEDARRLHGYRTILFVDEVHRWNKSQQDALLPWVENGTVILIGATTENPYFEVNRALVSRSRVFQLTPLAEPDLRAIADQALSDPQRGYGRFAVEFEPGALEHLVRISAGDARSLLNALQLAVETTPESFPPPENEPIHVSLAAAEESIQRRVVLYDKEGDYHFDTVSALIKSIRGSDPDAVLYWLALMIRAGEDPGFIFRRMLISACEDIGLAAPDAVSVVAACAAAFDRVGLPEGQYHLAHAALYLATCPKSNSALGYFDALSSIDEERNSEVPNHLKDASRDRHAFGHGEGYRYPHAWRDHWVAQRYLPEALSGRIFYRPGELGYEGSVRTEVLRRREEQVVHMLDDGAAVPGEILTFSPGDDERERWVRRTESSREPLSAAVRDVLFELWRPRRHDRVLIPADSGGLLVWEAHRRVPEGGVTVLCRRTQTWDALSWLAGGLPPAERPVLLNGGFDVLPADVLFDIVLARNWLAGMTDPERRLGELVAAAARTVPDGRMLLAEPDPASGTTPAGLMPPEVLDDKLRSLLLESEEAVRTDLESERSPAAVLELLAAAGWTEGRFENRQVTEERILSGALLENWFAADRPGGYGNRMARSMGEENWNRVSDQMKAALTGRRVRWSAGLRILISRRSA